MSNNDLITSTLGRLFKLGGLVGRVSVSVVGGQALNLLRSSPVQQVKTAENLIRNAGRIVETLGELKGAAMKVGQMLSLHENLLPPEVAAILSALQKEAPSVPFEVMEHQVRSEIEHFDELFASLEPNAFAAASIGQVHLGKLRDGRQVAVKIQYPEIDRIVRADLKNLKTFLGALMQMITNIDFDEVWEEVRDRLFEELDYSREAEHMRRMAKLHSDIPNIVVPDVVDNASTKRILTMEYVEGISPREACTNAYSQTLKDRWGTALFEFTMRGLLKHLLLHADPNFANFAFLDDGRLIVYDYGCMKRVKADLAYGYAALLDAVIHNRKTDVPELLFNMGIYKKNGKLLPQQVTAPFVDLAADILREDPPYAFGEDAAIYENLFDLGQTTWQAANDIVFPRDVVFIDRTLGGLFGNLSRLRATGRWRSLLQQYVDVRLNRKT